MLYHDSHSAYYRYPVGAIPAGGTLRLRFQCNEAAHVSLRTWDGEEKHIPMQNIGNDHFETTLTVPGAPMLFWYDFVIHRPHDEARYGTSFDQLGGVGAYYHGQPQSYQVTVYDPSFDTPTYLRNGIAYQIFPDRYFRDANGIKGRIRKVKTAHPDATFHENWNEAPTLDINPENHDNRALDFFGGTLRGIAQKLEMLKEMGVTVLYLNPIFRAQSNHRYDTGSYEEIDPILGDDAAFEVLIKEAKKLGMKVLLDGVFNHTGSDSQYFNKLGHYESLGAYQSKESPYFDWYHFDEFPIRYRTWWNFDTLPAVNANHPAYRHYLNNDDTGVIPGWVKRGACGWRLDVVDELPMDLVAEMRQSIKKVDDEAILLGEVWEDASNKIAYGVQRCYCLGDTLDSVMNYPLRRAVIDFFTGVINAHEIRRVILHQQEVYPAPFYYSLMNLLGSHDRLRILNAMVGYDRQGVPAMDREEAGKLVLGKKELKVAKKRYLSAMKLLCALPGMPTVYYGDEIGMTGMPDPWCRAPMAWDDQDEALKESLSKMLWHRQKHPLLQTGFLEVEAEDDDTLIIRRFSIAGKDVFGDKLTNKEQSIKITR